MPKKNPSPKPELEIPEELHLPEGDIEGVILTEESIEITEVHVFEEELEEDDFETAIFGSLKNKKPTTEEEEDIEDFNSYFFEE
jgi:hypothetical protein